MRPSRMATPMKPGLSSRGPTIFWTGGSNLLFELPRRSGVPGLLRGPNQLLRDDAYSRSQDLRPRAGPSCRPAPSVLVGLLRFATPSAMPLVSCSGRAKRSRALRGRNPTRDSPADGASKAPAPLRGCRSGALFFQPWNTGAMPQKIPEAGAEPQVHRAPARPYVTATEAGGCHVVPSRNMAQQRISKRRATATMAVLRRVFLPWQMRSNVARAQAL